MDKETLDKIKLLWFNGDGAINIVKKLDLKCHPITINRIAKSEKWNRLSNQKKSTNIILEYADKIIELFNSGVQASEIAIKLNLKYHNVIRFLRKQGCDLESLHYNFNNRQDIKKKRSDDGKKMWLEGRLDINRMRTPQAKQKSIENGILKWKDVEYKEKMRIIAREKWYKYRMWEKMKKFKETKPENAVAEILLLFNIKFLKNYLIGEGFSVDFYCPDLNLLLDVDGEYWHGRFKHLQDHKQIVYAIEKDRRKNEFIQNNTTYKYVRLWEQYTLSRESLITILGRIINKRLNIIDFSFTDLIFKEISKTDANNFIEKYHYIMRLGPFYKAFGAIFNETLITVCVFKYPTYATNHGCLELSRFCIHPLYQKKNLASFCLSRIIKMIDVNEIITYADQTQDHDGTIYHASNFEKIGYTSSSYYYIDEYNAKYHKKVIYNHAIKMKMTEDEYVKETGLIKIVEKPKIKFRYIKR